jgi:hypothetical protein
VVARTGLRGARRDDTLRLALLVVFPVIGFEQLVHTPPAALGAPPVYEALHWLSDSLLAPISFCRPPQSGSHWRSSWCRARSCMSKPTC